MGETRDEAKGLLFPPEELEDLLVGVVIGGLQCALARTRELCHLIIGHLIIVT